jgi:hypothetical protein
MRSFPYLLATSLALVAAACGGDDGNNGDPDAGPDAPSGGACGVEAVTLSAYPATHSGAVISSGDELDVVMGACADERGYYGPYGADEVIALTGLTAGSTYVIVLDTQEDLGFYVTGTCDAGGPAAGSCLLLVDESLSAEVGEFVAPAGGSVYVVIDTADGFALTDGAYTLNVREAECITSAECTTAGAPICSDYECVQCTSSFHCTDAGMPVCDGATNACVAGSDQCTGDDGGEPDDGPADATAIAFPTMATPTVVTAAVCSLPAIEGDWYTFTAAAAGSVRLSVDWTAGGADLDFLVYDSTGSAIAQGAASGAGPEVGVIELDAPGDYLIEVYQYEPASAAAATPYTMTLSIPECVSGFDCPLSTAPVCATGACTGGPATCTGDDAADDGAGGDDGPAAARDLTGAVGVATALTASLCNQPAAESDWYEVTVAQGEGLLAGLSWTGAADLDVYLHDGTGRLLGLAWWLMPESVTLTYLPAGTYYLAVRNATSPTSAAAVAYTITATRTATQTCATSADCAAVYSNQLYRGDCTAGACQFIPAGTAAAGAACDSSDDCLSGECSYIAFESDADKSVCTQTCTSSADCAGLGTGFACTTGFSSNVCVPSCTVDLECGANTQSSMLDVGQPWNYFTCTVATGACSP